MKLTSQCVRSVVQVLVVTVAMGVVIYEAITPQCGRPVVQFLVVRVDIGVVIYEAMTPQCGRSVVQVLVVRVDQELVTCAAMTSSVGLTNDMFYLRLLFLWLTVLIFVIKYKFALVAIFL